MVNYQYGKIYRIVCMETGEVYIGSTTQPLPKRLAGHRIQCKAQHKIGSRKLTSFPIIERGNYRIYLYEDFPCETKAQLERREGELIMSTKCVNKTTPGVDFKNNPEHRSAVKKRYRARNRDKYLAGCKDYYARNREKLLAGCKDYHARNRDKKLADMKAYRAKHRDRLQAYAADRVKCECGAELTRRNMAQHRKSVKHTQQLDMKFRGRWIHIFDRLVVLQ